MRSQLVLIFLASIASANAKVVFNTYEFGTTVPPNSGFSGGPQIEGDGFNGIGAATAVQFSLGFDDIITQIDFSIATDGVGPPDRNVTFALYNDNNGIPGTQIGSSLANVAGATTLGKTQSVAVNFSVTANTLYWLVGLPTDPLMSSLWDANISGVGGNWAIASPIGSWHTPIETTADPAFALEDSQGVTPEPASGLMTLSAFAIAVAARRRLRP